MRFKHLERAAPQVLKDDKLYTVIPQGKRRVAGARPSFEACIGVSLRGGDRYGEEAAELLQELFARGGRPGLLPELALEVAWSGPKYRGPPSP